jgi:hypothetical protein
MLPAYFPKSPKGTMIRFARIGTVAAIIYFATWQVSAIWPEFDILKFNNLQIVPYSRLPSLIDSGKLDDAQIDGC